MVKNKLLTDHSKQLPDNFAGEMSIYCDRGYKSLFKAISKAATKLQRNRHILNHLDVEEAQITEMVDNLLTTIDE